MMGAAKQKSSLGFLFFLGLFILFYFGFYALWGPRGYINYKEILGEVTALEDEYTSLTHKREKLEGRVKLMSSKSLNLDMLEERTRIMLNFAHPNDVIVYLD